MVNGKKRFGKLMVITLSLSLLVPTLAACSKKSDGDTQTERVLRIATVNGGGPDDSYTREQFTEIFEFANPNIKVEIVPVVDYDKYRYQRPKDGEQIKYDDPNEKIKELMNGDNPPDVVMVNYEALPELINENMLAPLDTYITKDKFDTSDIVPGVMEGLKKVGGDKLYALAPTFSASVLMYNKALFAQQGVEAPTDDMTWDQMFDLAKRVSKQDGDNSIYGFNFNRYSYSSSFWDMQSYTQPLQLRTYDEQGEKMTVDSDQWEKVWKTFLDLRLQKVLPQPPDPNKQMSEKEMNNPFNNDLFMSGKLAMVIAGTWDITEVINANRNADKIDGFTPIDWDIVAMPTHEEAPGVGSNIWMYPIVAINAKAQNPDDAWNYIKFINGEKWAQLKSKNVNNLVTRSKYIQPREGLSYNVAAFTKLSPAPIQNDYKLYQEMPNIGMVNNIGEQKFQEVLNKTKEVRAALKEWQTEGDAMLKEMKKNPNGPINMGGKGEAMSGTAVAQ